MKKTRKVIAALCATVLLLTCMPALAFVTPYENIKNNFICGATYALPEKDIEKNLSRDFSMMKNHYGIDTVSVYDLDTYDTDGRNTNKDILFKKLAEYQLKLVVRLEKYSSDFRFSAADATAVTESYAPLIRYVSDPARRSLVAYFALNMPVDDPTVQSNLGGLNSDSYLNAQPDYARRLVLSVRALTQQAGFTGARLYLSVFYGWDNSYRTPSYQDSGADGYFMNNYSYPAASEPAGADSTDLINEARLSISMERYITQYGNAPVVMEYGFHTAEYNGGAIASQTAGLVADKAAKQKALALTTQFYQQHYSFVEGSVYFGYNIVKTEGEDGLSLDWLLAYDEDVEPFVTVLPSVQNPNFDDGSDSWGVTGGFGDTAAIDGAAAKISLSDSGRDLFQSTGWTGERCRVRGLYVLSARVNIDGLTSGTVKLTAEFKNNGSTSRYYSSPSYGAFTTGGWHTMSVDIPAVAEGSYDEILYKLELSAGSGTILADDFRFVKQQSILFNGSFENGGDAADEWGMWPSWSGQDFLDTSYAADGIRCIKISLNAVQNYSLYSAPFIADNVTSGRLVCSIMVKTEDASATMVLHLNRGSGETIWSISYPLSGSSDWKLYRFEAPPDTAADSAQLQIELSAGTGTVFLDRATMIASSGLSGDINQDGIRDIRDIIRLKKGLGGFCPEYVLTDQNGDNTVDAADLVFIRKLLVMK